MRKFGWKQSNRTAKFKRNVKYEDGYDELPKTHFIGDTVWIDTVLDQGYTGSCVGQGAASAIRISKGVFDGATRLSSVALPSRRAIYRWARESHNEANLDAGTYIDSAEYVVRCFGFPDEEWFDWNMVLALSEGDPHDKWINEAVPASVRMKAFDNAKKVSFYRIYGLLEQRVEFVKRNLVNNIPILAGVFVDEAFMACQSREVQELRGASLGGHAIVIVGYCEEGLIILNSWGHGWGFGLGTDGGFGIISWKCLLSGIYELTPIVYTG